MADRLSANLHASPVIELAMKGGGRMVVRSPIVSATDFFARVVAESRSRFSIGTPHAGRGVE